MDANACRDVSRFFDDLEDPRVDRTRRHHLTDILMIALVAILGDAEHWTEVELFGRAKQSWFETFLQLPNGIPSHDTFSRVFARLDPVGLNRCFMRWVDHLKQSLNIKTLAVDGKTLRASGDAANDQPPLHMVSVWAHEAKLTLGQLACDGKSNEITAIPELLGMLELEGCTVTIDAMGCQRKIAQQILEQKGDYVLALKDNQKTLATDATLLFVEADDEPKAFWLDHHQTHETGHGRKEVRHYTTLKLTKHCEYRIAPNRWPGLKAIGRAISQRTVKDKTTTEARYFLLSRIMDAQSFGQAVRGHWGIENALHWVLDVTYDEDRACNRKNHGPQNMTIMRRLTLNILQLNRERTKMTMKAQRRKVGWDITFLDDLLQHVR